MEISEKHYDQWLPYSAVDVQLEFTMLDPHLRIPFVSTTVTANSTVFASQFRAPDAHGVFTVKVDHRRVGWSWLEEKMVISITPPRHNQFDRFITGALPYYSGAFSVTSAVFVFIIVWSLQ